MRREEKYEYNQCIPEKSMCFFLSEIIEVRPYFFIFSEIVSKFDIEFYKFIDD